MGDSNLSEEMKESGEHIKVGHSCRNSSRNILMNDSEFINTEIQLSRIDELELNSTILFAQGKQQDNFVGTTKNDHVYHSELESSNLPALGVEEGLENSSHGYQGCTRGGGSY